MSEAAKPSADALSRVPLFSGLERGELEQIAGQTSLLEFEPGSVVVREGERGPRVVAFFVVAEGRAGVSVDGEDRGTLEPGDYFGEIGLLRDAARTATVTAETELRCYGLSAWDFRSCLRDRPDISLKLLEELARRLEQ